MYRFWPVTKQLLDAIDVSLVVEIGSDTGLQTRLLAEYCDTHRAQLHVIDPLPKYDVELFSKEFQTPPFFHLDTSISSLTKISAPSAVLIDGDHNYYTVRTELEILRDQARHQGNALPLILLHDVCWPYGRRDLYYDPDTIPEEFLHPWRRAGLHPDKSEPDESEALCVRVR